MRAATIRGLSRSPTAGVFSEVNEAFTPRSLPNLAAWFDALDTSSMLSATGTTITDGGAVALWGDKSGNSGVNCLIVPGGIASNDASIPTIGALGTSDFTIVATVRIFAQVATYDQGLVTIPNGTNGLSFSVRGSTRRLQTGKAGVGYNSAASGTDIPLDSWITVGYRRSGTTATYFLSGVPDGTATDSYDYTASSALGFLPSSTSYTSTRSMRNVRIYSAALSDAEVLADYNGTVQANCVVNIDFSTAAKKLANGDTFVCATGQTVTLNSSGATGARIAGERDLYQGTLANRPVYLNYAGTKYGYLNGTAGNYFSTPHSDAVNIADDIEIIAKLALADWTPSVAQEIVCKGTDSTAYRVRIETSGAISFFCTLGNLTTASIQAPSFADGATGWIKVTRPKTSGVVTSYFSNDGVTWTTSGQNTLSAGSSLGTNTNPLNIGQATNASTGRVFYVSVSNSIGGAPVAAFDPSAYTSGTTFTASTGEVWTINGGAHIVTRTGLYGNGSTTAMVSPSFSFARPQTAYVVTDMVSWTDLDEIIDGNGSTPAVLGVRQRTSSPNMETSDSGTSTALVSVPLKAAGVLSATWTTSNTTFRLNRGTAVSSGAGTTNAANGLTVFARNNSGTPDRNANAVISEAAFYSAAHATATQDRMALYAGRRHGFAV